MAGDETVEVLEGAEVAYDVAMRRLDEQMRQIDAIDNKIGVVVGASSAIATLFAGFASVAVRTESSDSLWVGVAFITVVTLLYVPTVLFGMFGYLVHEWDVRPNWDQLLSFSKDYSDQVMRSWVAQACVASLKGNSRGISAKLTRFGWSTRLLACETLMAAAGLLAIVSANAVG